jgi:hypothetical protein
MSKQQPLTDEQIRAELQKRKDLLMGIALDLEALQEALFAKGVLTNDDMAKAVLVVTQKSKERLAQIADANRTKPPDRVQ